MAAKKGVAMTRFNVFLLVFFFLRFRGGFAISFRL